MDNIFDGSRNISKTNDKISYVEIGQGGMNKVAENIAQRAVDGILDFNRGKYGKACVAIGNAFRVYLKNFVNTQHIGKYVPVLVELRKIEDAEKHALLNRRKLTEIIHQ